MRYGVGIMASTPECTYGHATSCRSGPKVQVCMEINEQVSSLRVERT